MKPFPTLLVALLAACGGDAPPAPQREDPPPGEDHQLEIGRRVDAVIGENHDLASPSGFRFDEPQRDRVALWHWESQEDGVKHSFGFHHGWRVDFWFTPDYEGYPEQPESQRMAFFAEGALRGLFFAGGNTAPHELDKWEPMWIDESWPPRKTPSAPPK